MQSFNSRLLPLLLFTLPNVAIGVNDVDAGFDAYTAAQVMGTAAEALLELHNPELSVFGSDPFPDGRVPQADPNTAVGVPASLGVSAILLGQSNSVYIGAANREADFLLNVAPRWSNGAISHRPDVAELWADNMAMSFPFLAYLAVEQNDTSLMSLTVQQCGLQRAVLKGNNLNWQHIIGPQSQDTGLWLVSNGWASYGMSNLDDGLLRNYLDDPSWFGEISGTSVLSAVAYRMAVNDPNIFPQSYIAWADANRESLAEKQDDSGIFAGC
ncbi:hypothetical protein GGI43DRAFT_430465 [Trichoderma evansii]